jgi:hypothetical protein
MSPDELKAVFKRMLLGAAAPVMLGSCGPMVVGSGPPNCQPQTQRIYFSDAGIPDSGYAYCTDATADAGRPAVDCPQFCTGRLPAGRVETDMGTLRGPGGYLARMAHFEAASVAAFNQLAEELEAHGAPRALVDFAKAAAKDEVRHAQAVAALARKRGVRPPAPRVRATPLRSVFELALDNAREGCVREAFGALVGLHQAQHATDVEVKRAMHAIAHDEVTHASFSFQLARYLDSQLDDAQREQVAAARDEAIGAVLAQALTFEDVEWREAFGLPDADTLYALARAFHTQFASA